MCLTYSRVTTGKQLFGTFPIKNGLKPDALSQFIFSFALEYAIRNFLAFIHDYFLYKYDYIYTVVS
jgi:hypothetical protein